MKRLMTGAAVAALVAFPAVAQQEGQGPFLTQDQQGGQQQEMQSRLSADELLGHRIHAASGGVGEGSTSDPDQSWEDIGEVSDVLLSRDGQVEAILVDVGGFLGIGERQVAVRMDAVTFVQDSDDQGSFFLVVDADRSMIENAPEYQMQENRQAGSGTGGAMPEGGAEQDTAAAGGSDMQQQGGTSGETGSQEMASDGQAATDIERGDDVAGTQSGTGEDSQQMADSQSGTGEESQQMASDSGDPAMSGTQGDGQDIAVTDEETTGTLGSEQDISAMDQQQATDQEQTALIDGQSTAGIDENRDTAAAGGAAGAMGEDGWMERDMATMTAEELEGAELYGSNDERIGEISQLVIAESGKIQDVVVDIGGFLGIGEKSVALPMQDLTFRSSDVGDVRAYVNATQEELENMPSAD